MNTDFVLTDSQRQMMRREQLKVTSMKKSWSMDSLNSMNGGGGTKTCLCAPTTHAGSFRCRHHRIPSNNNLSHMAHQPSPIFEIHEEEQEEEVRHDEAPTKPSSLSQGGSIFDSVHEDEIYEPKPEEKVVTNDYETEKK